MNESALIEIKGDVVYLVNRQIERIVKLSDWIDQIKRTSGMKTPILPIGCRLAAQGEFGSIFVIEQPPQVRWVTWNKIPGCVKTEQPNPLWREGSRLAQTTLQYDETIQNKWKLSFPFVVFVLKFNRSGAFEIGYVYYRTSPISAEKDDLLQSNLGNVHHDNKICTGDMKIDAESTTLAHKANDFVSKFWTLSFNSDLQQLFNEAKCIDEVFATVSSWQEATTKNPLFCLQTKWPKVTTIKAMLTALGVK